MYPGYLGYPVGYNFVFLVTHLPVQHQIYSMNFKKIYHKLFCIMQWNIGISKGDIAQIIREKKFNLSFKWMPLNEAGKSIADPFLFRSKEGQLNIIYEEFSMENLNKYGFPELYKYCHFLQK